MQAAMDRDEDGRTEYSMCAVDPSRVSKSKLLMSNTLIVKNLKLTNYAEFTEENLLGIVDLIAGRCKSLLQIVNYNIAGQQYVCGGHVGILLLHHARPLC
jgi:fatty acid synthase subunit beta